jgi:hypothetical protein
MMGFAPRQLILVLGTCGSRGFCNFVKEANSLKLSCMIKRVGRTTSNFHQINGLRDNPFSRDEDHFHHGERLQTMGFLFNFRSCFSAASTVGPRGLSDENSKNSIEDNEVVSLGVQEQHQLRVAKAFRQQTVERLWDITEKLNILYKDNWTALADREMVKFQTELFSHHKKAEAIVARTREEDEYAANKVESAASNGGVTDEWSFPSSFLYSLSLITTVGKN